MRERHVSELLAEVFRRGGLKRGVRRAEAVLLWRRLVGPELAAFSAAKVLRDGVLYVNVSDSETAMHLSMERQRFITAYRERYLVTDVREIRFQVGKLDESEHVQPAHAPPAPDPGDLQRLTRALTTLDLPADVERGVLAAGRSLLALQAARRALGWTACPCCGVLHEGALQPETLREAALREAQRHDIDVELGREFCLACARYAKEARVVALARTLQATPLAVTAGVSDEELAVARHLAGRALDAQLATLLPAAVSDQRLAGRLAAVARARLALRHGRPPATFTLEDIATLDARIAQLLAITGVGE